MNTDLRTKIISAVLGAIIGLAISSLTICRGADAKRENEAINASINLEKLIV